MLPLKLRTSLQRLTSSAWTLRHARGAQAAAKAVAKLRTFNPSMTSHPIFERRGDENIWRSKDSTPESGDLITYLQSTPWIDIVSPEIRRSFDDHTMRSHADAANYLVAWSGILRRMLPSSHGYSLHWEVVSRHHVSFEHLTVSKKDRHGAERIVLLVVAHSDYAGIGDYEKYMDWRVGFLEFDIERRADETMDSGEAGERLPWIGAMGHRFMLGVKDKESGLNRIGDGSNAIFDVYDYGSKPVLLRFIKNIHSLVL